MGQEAVIGRTPVVFLLLRRRIRSARSYNGGTVIRRRQPAGSASSDPSQRAAGMTGTHRICGRVLWRRARFSRGVPQCPLLVPLLFLHASRGPGIGGGSLREHNFLVRVRCTRRGYKGVHRWREKKKKKRRFACLLGDRSWRALWKIPVMP